MVGGIDLSKWGGMNCMGNEMVGRGAIKHGIFGLLEENDQGIWGVRFVLFH